MVLGDLYVPRIPYQLADETSGLSWKSVSQRHYWIVYKSMCTAIKGSSFATWTEKSMKIKEPQYTVKDKNLDIALKFTFS